MTEVLFFHLQRQPLERVLPMLLQRSLDRGWRAVVKASSAERVAALDDYLWTFADESFLPHGTEADADCALHPVLLTSTDANPNGASVLFLVDGAAIPSDVAPYARVTLLFDGNDDAALAAARRSWSDITRAGHPATYWQEEGGRWVKKAEGRACESRAGDNRAGAS